MHSFACLKTLLRTALPCCLIAFAAIPAMADSFISSFIGTSGGNSVNASAILTADVGGTSAADVLGWRSSSRGTTTYFNALGFTGPGSNPPDELILGLPSSSKSTTITYPFANGSITQSDPHQPFVVGTGSFSFTVGTNRVEGWRPANATMFFGCTGLTCPNDTAPAALPEPNSFLLLGVGLVAMACFHRRRNMKQFQRVFSSQSASGRR